MKARASLFSILLLSREIDLLLLLLGLDLLLDLREWRALTQSSRLRLLLLDRELRLLLPLECERDLLLSLLREGKEGPILLLV